MRGLLAIVAAALAAVTALPAAAQDRTGVTDTTIKIGIPVGLSGLWETAFARNGKSTAARLGSLRPGRRLEVKVGAPLPHDVSVEELRAKVQGLLDPVAAASRPQPSEARG